MEEPEILKVSELISHIAPRFCKWSVNWYTRIYKCKI